MKMLHCPICGKNKPANRRQKTCSRKCGAVWVEQEYGPEHMQRVRLKAAAVSGAKRRKDAIRRWLERYPGVPRETIQAIYIWGYHGGRRAGVAAGYEQALRDTERARVA